MTSLQWTLVAVGTLLVLYAGFVLALVIAGRRSEARALGGFIPDCIVLFRRLLADPRVSGWRKGAIILLVAYLAMPIDLGPTSSPWPGSWMT